MQENVTAVAVCENPGVSLPLVPLLACKETEVIVKLPVGTKLKRVTTLGKTVVGNLTTTGAEAEYVKISTNGETVRKYLLNENHIAEQLRANDDFFIFSSCRIQSLRWFSFLVTKC